MGGGTLDEAENAFYEGLDSGLLSSKCEWLAKAAKAMVAIKALTAAERVAGAGACRSLPSSARKTPPSFREPRHCRRR